MNYAIILAGGSGTRFWPLSRTQEPKQFLNLCSDKPLITQAVHRIKKILEAENIYIATNKIYQKNIKACLKGLGIPRGNLFFEPLSKNTLAPIGALSNLIYRCDNDALITVIASDHYLKNEPIFLKALKEGLVTANKGYIVTIGIKPDRPHTGYGYIKTKTQDTRRKAQVFAVEKFIEKPDIKRAKEFLKDKRYYWNAGIFIFRADTMLKAIKKFASRDFRVINKIKDKKSMNRQWKRFRPVSIDYAIMEKAKNIALIPADFGWVDLGSLSAIEYFSKKDGYGNIFKGRCIDIGSKNTLAWSGHRLLATLGLDNIIIVDTKDALLVCAKDKAQDVKAIVRALKQRKLIK